MKYFDKGGGGMQDEEMIFRLLRNIMSNLSMQMNRCYEPFGITGVQCLVLMEVATSDEELKISELARRLMMSNSNISAIVKRLEQHELLERKRNKLDERVVTLSLTKKAKLCMKEMRKCKRHEPMLYCLDDQQREQIIESLKLLDQAVLGGNGNEQNE